jgi:hypothetical protein
VFGPSCGLLLPRSSDVDLRGSGPEGVVELDVIVASGDHDCDGVRRRAVDTVVVDGGGVAAVDEVRAEHGVWEASVVASFFGGDVVAA